MTMQQLKAEEKAAALAVVTSLQEMISAGQCRVKMSDGSMSWVVTSERGVYATLQRTQLSVSVDVDNNKKSTVVISLSELPKQAWKSFVQVLENNKKKGD